MLTVAPLRQEPGLCGPTCLKMILDWYGLNHSIAELTKLSGATPEDGVEADGLQKAAEKLGLQVVIQDNCTLDDIADYVNKKKIPVIVDWFSTDDGHYSVAVAIDKQQITLQDPELGGLRLMDTTTFQRVWFDFPGDLINNKNDVTLRRLIAIFPKK